MSVSPQVVKSRRSKWSELIRRDNPVWIKKDYHHHEFNEADQTSADGISKTNWLIKQQIFCSEITSLFSQILHSSANICFHKTVDLFSKNNKFIFYL